MLEQQIISCMLQDNTLIPDTQLESRHFTNHVYKLMFAEMKLLNQEGKAADQVTLIERIYEKLNSHQDLDFLTDIEHKGNVMNFDSYEKELTDQYINQSTRSTLEKHLSQKELNIEEMLNEIETIQANRDDELGDPFDLYMRLMDEPYIQQEKKRGITTGFVNLDLKTGGFKKTELTVVAARPSMGKSALMMKFVLSALKSGALPMVFSLEMSEEALMKRIISQELQIETRMTRNPYLLNDSIKDKWKELVAWLSEQPHKIYTKKRTIPEIRSAVRKTKRDFPNKEVVVFIDYLTLLETEKKFQSENYKVEYYSRSLKHMAMDFDIPVVTLAQLSRGVEQRPDKHPMLSDLRDSGAIEQDANNVFLLYRDAYYYPDSEKKNVLEVNVAKQREGPTGKVDVFYNLTTGQMRDLQ